MRLFTLFVLVAACGPEPQPNAAGLIVSGNQGLPVFEWSGEEQQELGVEDADLNPMLEIVAAGDPPTCVNGMQSPVRWGQVPMGFQEATYAGAPVAAPTLADGDDYTAYVALCVSDGTFERSSVLFSVVGGNIQMDCKHSLCP